MSTMARMSDFIAEHIRGTFRARPLERTMPEPLHEPGPELAEKNRELLAERGGWPPEALATVRQLERRHPGWHCWWTPRPWRKDGNVPDGPAYGADRARRAQAGGALYAATPGELAEMIEADGSCSSPW